MPCSFHSHVGPHHVVPEYTISILHSLYLMFFCMCFACSFGWFTHPIIFFFLSTIISISSNIVVLPSPPLPFPAGPPPPRVVLVLQNRPNVCFPSKGWRSWPIASTSRATLRPPSATACSCGGRSLTTPECCYCSRPSTSNAAGWTGEFQIMSPSVHQGMRLERKCQGVGKGIGCASYRLYVMGVNSGTLVMEIVFRNLHHLSFYSRPSCKVWPIKCSDL